MCDPISIGLAALSVGQAGMQYMGQNALAKDARTTANLNYARESEIIGQKAVQLDKAKSEDAFDTAIAAVRAEGDIAASATDRGLAPTSIIQALNADMFGIGRQASIEDLNDQNARQQLANEGTGAEITRQTTIANTPKASGLSLVLGVGQGVAGGFQANAKRQSAGSK